MAYGDTGVGGDAKGPFKGPIPWTWGKVVGKDAMNNALSKDVKFMIDTGATTSAVAKDTLMGFQVVFQGVITKTVVGGKAAFTTYKGPTLQVKATTGDLKYTGLFFLEPATEAETASLVGVDFAKATGAIFTINTAGKKVTIST